MRDNVRDGYGVRVAKWRGCFFGCYVRGIEVRLDVGMEAKGQQNLNAEARSVNCERR